MRGTDRYEESVHAIVKGKREKNPDDQCGERFLFLLPLLLLLLPDLLMLSPSSNSGLVKVNVIHNSIEGVTIWYE